MNKIQDLLYQRKKEKERLNKLLSEIDKHHRLYQSAQQQYRAKLIERHVVTRIKNKLDLLIEKLYQY